MSSYANGCMVVVLPEEHIDEFERYFDQDCEYSFLNTEIMLTDSESADKAGYQKRIYDISCNTSLEACLIENEDNDIRDVCFELGIASMYEGTESNIGKIGIIPLSGLTNDYKKPEYQLFRLDGGFGCSPAGRGNSCFGKFCADGSEARMEKFDFIGIGNAEVEKIAQELEVGWSGGASGCAERERELDGPEM